MLTDRQIERMLGKLRRFEKTLEAQMFQKVGTIAMKAYQTDGGHTIVPDDSLFQAVEQGTVFEGEGIYVWTKGSFKVPEALAGKELHFYPHTDAYEGMMFVDGMPYGNFASKMVVNSHGNHYCKMFVKEAVAGKTYELATEHYANHFIKGTQPLEDDPKMEFKVTVRDGDICVVDEIISDFYYNLHIVNQMAESMDADSFRRGKIINALKKVHEVVYYDYDSVARELFIAAIVQSNKWLKEILADKNSVSAPYVGFIGHSHMDTAWLWHRGETDKKCARTYANQMNLMDRYEGYTFIQSSAHHGDIIRRLYPSLFKEIQKRVAQGRYEPNGGVWVECDCNIPSGEYMIRQFLLGQRFTRKYFNYTSDTFWLPDTFGYSAALPQIMKGCGVDYFLTTKIAWNDTNEFPYDTFWWKGIDGSKVLTHFNKTHLWPTPKEMNTYVQKSGHDANKERSVSDKRLLSYGFGDGGGGPEFEMVEMANRVEDVEGLPRTKHTLVSTFMQELEAQLVEPSTHTGELYLELHRGTLTNQHQIKRNNRKAEIALRSLEYFTVNQAVLDGSVASHAAIAPLTDELLINQFHDILPGTGIPIVHQEAIASVSNVIEQAQELQSGIISNAARKEDSVTVFNTLSFERSDVQYIPYQGSNLNGVKAQQLVTNIDGEQYLAIGDVTLPAFSSVVLGYDDAKPLGDGQQFFSYDAGIMKLETPFYQVAFNEKGYIDSLVDKRVARELRGDGYAFNTMLIGEDVPLAWDNWDIDADLEFKLRDEATLLSRAVVSIGDVEIRIRSIYQLTPKSTLTQDMIFYSGQALISFDSKLDWQDDHRFLKTAFDTDIHTDKATQEIQFGYLSRPTNRNTSIEKAMFEVTNHKYTDLSETRYGISLLNDCKYGISVKDGSMSLSLHKGGNMPDFNGDKGIHYLSYGLLPHVGGFGAAEVIQPAYMFNTPLVCEGGALERTSFLQVSENNLIVETVKPLEDEECGYLLRIYEAEGTRTNAKLTLSHDTKSVHLTNMLEEEQELLEGAREFAITFAPFEIKSVKVTY